MPLSINVGLSRKASRDYQSTGASINVTAELDQSLLAKPAELQAQIGDLYAQAQQAMDRQVGAIAEPEQRPTQLAARTAASTTARTAARATGANGNGGNGNGHGRNGAAATDSQRRAIQAISRRLNIDVDAECRDMIGVEFADLSLKQASEMIDHLKSIEPASGRNGR